MLQEQLSATLLAFASEDANPGVISRYVALVAAVGMCGKSSIISYKDVWTAS